VEPKGNNTLRRWDEVFRQYRSSAPPIRQPLFLHDLRIELLSYEDEQSVGLKGSYVKEGGLPGIMFWEYKGD